MERLSQDLGNWWYIIKDIFYEKEMIEIGKTINKLYKTTTVLPDRDLMFNAFKLCSPTSLRCIILGQDPYPTIGVPNGLAFGTNSKKIPPSLRIIIDELNLEYKNEIPRVVDTTLSMWARQGVLLLNTALTVEANNPGSHLELWKPFIRLFVEAAKSWLIGSVVMLWGNYAQSFGDIFNENDFYVLKAAHPAAELRRKNAGFYGCNHFVETNKILMSKRTNPINWFLTGY